MPKILKSHYARITFNKNGYQGPSGPDGKSMNPATFEKQEGFGWDEWLFNKDFVIDGYQYGFIQGLSTDKTYTLKSLHLFSYSDGKWIYKAKIRDMEILDDATANNIAKAYEKAGLWDKILGSLNPKQKKTARELKRIGFRNIINVRFKPSSLEVFNKNFKGSLPFRYRLYEVKPEMAKLLSK